MLKQDLLSCVEDYFLGVTNPRRAGDNCARAGSAILRLRKGCLRGHRPLESRRQLRSSRISNPA